MWQFYGGLNSSAFSIPGPNSQVAKWWSSNTTTTGSFAAAASVVNPYLLYRSLGLLDVRNKTQGLGFGGRIPAKVNINTNWDSFTGASSAIWNALCDPTSASSTGNLFTAANNVNPAWAALNANRAMIGNPGNSTPTSPPPAWPTAAKALADQPFLPPSDNFTPASDAQFTQYTAGQGVQNTILGMYKLANTTTQTSGVASAATIRTSKTNC